MKLQRSSAFAALVALHAGAAAPSQGPDPRGLDDLAPGQWFEIPATRLIDVAPAESPGGSTLKLVAWSGGALDTRRDRLVVWGGGHSDYAGNEVYAFDLSRMRWERLTEPSVADRGRTATYADGQPRARHTYNYIEYVPSIDRIVSFGASGPYPSGGGEFSRDLAEFDPDSERWVTTGRRPVPLPGNMIGAHARLDPVTGRIYFLGSQRAALHAYDPAGDSWRSGGRPTRIRVHATAAIEPERREFYVIGSGGAAGGQMIRWHLDRPDAPEDLSGRTVGDTAIESAYGPGFDFDSRLRLLVAWAGGTDVYVLEPEVLRWTRVAPAGENRADPGPANPTGTYGRFRYSARHGVFVLMNTPDRNVYAYRPDPAAFARVNRVAGAKGSSTSHKSRP